MALRINTNIAAMNAHKNMINNDNALSSSLQRLSSGLRINKAADDASGMVIADSLKSQSMSLGQAIRNANDGISMVQTADGALQEAINIVNTIKTKSIQAAQDGQTTESRKTIQADIDKLMEELDIIAKTTSFNGQKLLSGQFTNKKFQVGAFSGETVGVSIGSTEASKMGHVTTGTLTPSNAGEVRLSIYSNVQNADIALQSVTLAYDNTADNSIGALADAINKVADLTGVTAQAKVESTSNAAVAAGSTGSDFAINDVVIGSLTVLANDSDGSLVNAINAKSAQHGILASTDESGFLTLTSTDGRAIKVSGDSGTTLMGSDLSTLGEIKLFQTGANEIQISDEAETVSLNLTTAVGTDGATTTTVDSTLTKDSVVTAGSLIRAGSTLGFASIGGDAAGLSGVDVTTTQDSLIKAGSTLGSTSMIKTGTTLGGTADLHSGVTTTTDSLLKTGTILGSSSVLTAGTTVTTRLKATTGWIEAGTTLGSDVTLSNGTNTLLADMSVKKDAVFTSMSIIQTGSSVGGDFKLEKMTLTNDMTLKAGSVITLSAGSTTFLAGSIIGADLTLSDGSQTVSQDMTLKAGSVLNSNSQLAKGSTIGGSVTASSAVTVASDMTLAAGSQLAADSTLKAGTVLTNDIHVAGGDLLKAGTVLTGDVVTSGTNYLNNSMTLEADSVIASGSVLAATATSSSGATATTSLSDVQKYKLSDLDVTTQDGAQVAISIADSALKNLDKVRADLGSVQNQFTSNIANLSVTQVNLSAAESSIRDVDFAAEAQNFSRLQVLAQTGAYAMSQANASAQVVLSLLQ
jgi:flagellin